MGHSSFIWAYGMKWAEIQRCLYVQYVVNVLLQQSVCVYDRSKIFENSRTTCPMQRDHDARPHRAVMTDGNRPEP
jgi:hypothetical protein